MKKLLLWFLILFLGSFTLNALAQTINFDDHPRLEICLNGNWQRIQGKNAYFPQGLPKVRVPGAMQLDDLTLESNSWYRKTFILPEVFKDDHAKWFIYFEKAGWYSKVIINGKTVGENYGSIIPIEFDITDALKWGNENEILVFVHAADATHTVPNTKVEDIYEAIGFRSGGRLHRNWAQIQGDVKLIKRPKTNIKWHRADCSVRNRELTVRGTTENNDSQISRIEASVFDMDTGRKELAFTIPFDKDKSEFNRTVSWKDPVLWGFADYGQPKLYALRLELFDSNDVMLDATVSRFGFREVWYDDYKLMLNGKELMLAAATIPYGTEREATYMHPYGVFERNQMARYFQILRDSGFNGFHNHFDTFDDSIYDVADEMGVLVVAGAYCNGPGWLASATGMHEKWTQFMHDAIAEWAKNTGDHTSVVYWNPVCGIPHDVSGKGLDHAFACLDYGGAIRKTDKTRPIVGDGVAYIKNGIDRIREDVKKKFINDGKPRFIKEVWAIDENWDMARENSKGMIKFFKDHNVSGYITFGKTFQLFPFNISWPSSSGPGIRWSVFSPAYQFKSFINWCDTSQPLYKKGTIAQNLSQQYQSLYSSPGNTEPLVYPDILTINHPAGALFMAAKTITDFNPAPQVVLLDENSTGYINVKFPGKVHVYDISKDDIQIKNVVAQKQKLPLIPGYQNMITVDWNQKEQ